VDCSVFKRNLPPKEAIATIRGYDTVFTGEGPPPYAVGELLWPIPRMYVVVESEQVVATQFATGNHHQTSDQAGKATIEKAEPAHSLRMLPTLPHSKVALHLPQETIMKFKKPAILMGMFAALMVLLAAPPYFKYLAEESLRQH